MYRKHEWEKQIKGGHFSKYTLEAKRYMKNGLEYKDYWYRTHLSLDELYGAQRMDFRAPGPLVEELIEQKILINALYAAIDRLPEREKKAVLLFGDAVTEDQIGSEIGMPQPDVSRMLKRVWIKLAVELEEYR